MIAKWHLGQCLVQHVFVWNGRSTQTTTIPIDTTNVQDGFILLEDQLDNTDVKRIVY